MRLQATRFFCGGFFLAMLSFLVPKLAAEEAAADSAKTTAASSSTDTPPSKATDSAAAEQPPTDWIDPATGHRIIRLSREPGTSSMYFHQNGYTDDKLFVTITPPRSGRGADRPINGPNDPLDGGSEQHDRGTGASDEAGNQREGPSAKGGGNSQSGQSNVQSSEGNAQSSGGNAPSGGGNAPSSGNAQFRGGFFRPVTLATIDLSTLGVSPPTIDKVAEGFDRGMVVGKKSGNVYYIRSQYVDGAPIDKVYATNLNTHDTREIGTLPFRGGSGVAVNADETLLGGSYVVDGTGRRGEAGGSPGQGPAADQNPAGGKPTQQSSDNGKSRSKAGDTASNPRSAEQRAAAPGDGNSNTEAPRGGESSPQASQRQIRTFGTRERGIAARYAAHLPMKLFTMNIQTGETQTFHPSTDWLNHVQFSPTDPTLMMFCHEGPWHEVDRIWTIRVGSDDAKLMHHRTMPYEIAGHEFFGYDGTVWYDLQTPRSGKFWLAGVNVDTGQRTWYPLERSQWSVHYNQSHDGKLFAGDGGGPGSVANRTPLPDNKPLDKPGNGQWIYLFTPVAGETETKQVGDETVNIGKFSVEKLVDMSKHNYEFEPNVTFSPDNKWVIFRSNMHGPIHTYAVEIAKSQ